MAKNFNPLTNATDALQLLLSFSPMEVRQQAIRAAGVIKQALDAEKRDISRLELLEGQNEALRQQLSSLQTELSALQFVEPIQEKKRGRKSTG